MQGKINLTRVYKYLVHLKRKEKKKKIFHKINLLCYRSFPTRPPIFRANPICDDPLLQISASVFGPSMTFAVCVTFFFLFLHFLTNLILHRKLL